MLLLIAGHALIGLWAPLVLLGFQLFNPELATVERWPYLQMLLVIIFCWQGSIAWQQKSVAEQYFVESLAPSARVAWLSNKLMALLNQLPFWFLALPVLVYLLFSGKTMAWLDATQLLLVLLVLCWGFQAQPDQLVRSFGCICVACCHGLEPTAGGFDADRESFYSIT